MFMVRAALITSSTAPVVRVRVRVVLLAKLQRHLADDQWTEEETGILFELCRKFDLRFIVVHDHFKRRFAAGAGDSEFVPRSVEDLKARLVLGSQMQPNPSLASC
jgi:hypothetical protein